MAIRYWVGGAGSWSSTTKWSATSGGGSGASVPISTDDVVFDAASGLVGLVATVDTAQTCATLTITPSATVGFSTLAITASLTVTGLFSMGTTAGNQRFLIRGNTYGLATDFSVGSASSLADLDFRDLRVIGAAAPLSGTRIGDLRGVTGVTFSTAKTVYWNLAGAQNWSATGWAATSGGAPATANFPLAQDTAVFDDTGSVTGTITMNAAIPYTGTVDMSARTAAMTLATTAFTIYGDWKNGTGTTLSGTTALTFSGRNTQTITSAGKTFTQPITIDTYGGIVSLVDALNIGATTLTVTNGTFTTNSFAVTAGILSSSNSNVRAINLGASTLTLSATVTLTTATNLTFNAGLSTINLLQGTPINFNGGGLSFNNVNFTGTVATTHLINGATTFANLTFTAPAATGITGCNFSANQTITGTLTCAGATAIRRIFLRSDALNTQRTLTCGAVSAQDGDFRDIAISGAAAPYNASSLRVGDCGGNSGITFRAGLSRYWNFSGSQNWSATGWSDTSGGTPNAIYFPLAQDTATFNAAGSVTGTITVDAAWNIGSVDMLGRVVTTFPMIISIGTNLPIVYGGWAFGTGVTSTSSSGVLTFAGRGTQTITSNGIAFGHNVYVDSISGTTQLADAFALTLGAIRNFQVTSGTFDAVSFNVTAGTLTLTNGTVKMGSGTWTLSGTGSVWTNTAGTLYKGTANIVLSDTSATARTFAGGSQSYNKLTIGGATGSSTTTITGDNQFTELASTKTVAHTIDFGATTQTFGAWTVTGTVGNVATVTGTATLTIAGARVSGVDYLALGTTVISATSPGEFYAGANSTGGTNAILTAAPAAVTRYWRGGTGTWDATTTTNWSATSGGAGGASVPKSADAVVFDTLSNATAYTVTLTATQLRCASLTIAGPLSGNLTFAGTAPLTIHGNVTLPATGITYTYTGAITLSGSTTGKTFTTNGASLSSAFTVNGIGCGWTFGSAATLGGTFTVTNGSFDTGNFAMSCTTLSSSNTNTRSITFGTSTITLSSFDTTISTNLTFSAGTSTLSFASAGSTLVAGLTFNNVSFPSGASPTISTENTFVNLTFGGPTNFGTVGPSFGANQTITGTLTFTAGADATKRGFVQSNIVGTTRTLTCGAFVGTDVDFRDITIAGAAAPVSGTRLGDCKGNSGITFGAGVNKYWNLAAGGNWGGAIAWATSSGGTPAINNFPLAQDTAWFESTGLNSGATITMSANYNVGTINMSGRITNTMILATGSTGATVYGNWINGSGVSFTGAAAITFAGRSSQTVTSAGVSFSQPFAINTPSGSVTLLDALNLTTQAVTVTAGTFDANGTNVTASALISTGTAVRTVAVGSGIWTLSLNTTPWNATASPNLTITGTGTIRLTASSTKTFFGGNFAYTNITLDQGGAGTLTISGNNTFKDITSTYTATAAATINFAATTTTLSQFTAAGTASKLLTVTGTSAASPATLITTGAIDSNYLPVNNVKAYATASTWYAGPNSTNGGTLGWIFTAALKIGNFFRMF